MSKEERDSDLSNITYQNGKLEVHIKGQDKKRPGIIPLSHTHGLNMKHTNSSVELERRIGIFGGNNHKKL